jgi:hypothetical protein
VQPGHLERAIAAAVKSQCEGFVGVLLERIKPQSRSAPNWAIRGIRFGKADREKSRKALGTVMEFVVMRASPSIAPHEPEQDTYCAAALLNTAR